MSTADESQEITAGMMAGMLGNPEMQLTLLAQMIANFSSLAQSAKALGRYELAHQALNVCQALMAKVKV